MGVGVTDEACFGGTAEHYLQHGQVEEFGVDEFRGDPDRRPFRPPLWVFDQRIVDRYVESGCEGLQVRVQLFPDEQVCPSP